MKYTRFRDVPPFTRDGSWECDFGIDEVWPFIDRQRKELPSTVDLNPDFQRGHVWTKKQQEAWLEFFIRGGKTGRVIYFNHPGWQDDYKGTMEIVDGKQRLEAIRLFINNEIKVFGSYRREFTDNLRITQTIRININTLKTRAQVLQWYLDFNSGGTPHTEEEISKVRDLLAKE